MLFKTALLTAVSLVFASQAMGAAVNQERASDGIQIATDPVAACNCPNNCSHKQGSSCKFYTGPSDTSPIANGHCNNTGGRLVCIRDG